MATPQARLQSVERAFSKLRELLANDEGDHDNLPDSFIKLMKRVCDVVRDTGADNADILQRAEGLLNVMIEFAYGDSELFDFMPSFAHDNERGAPLVKDLQGEGGFPAGVLDSMGPLLKMLLGGRPMPESAKGLLTRAEKWNASTHIPNKFSTPCSRFRVGDGSPTFIPTDSNTLATNIFQARCEVTADRILNPINLLISPGSEFMVVLAAGGYKDREPHMHYYSLKSLRDGSGEFPPDRTMDIPLADIVYGVGIDQERKLVFVGSFNHLKSYYWGMVDNSVNGRKPPKLLPTHTFCTTRFAGPITILPAGRLIRAGRGSAGVWNLDSQPTHGPEGTDIIGEQMDPEHLDTWRDEDADIELSEGSNPDTIIAFEDSKFKPSLWHTHPDPSKPAVMLAATDAGGMGEATYYCRTLDLENGGQVITRYLGHGGTVQAFSTSAGDPNVFLTTASDGLARLYDVRIPLPVLTLDGGDASQSCPDGILIHPDGHPFAFTGSGRSEQIKLWDLRARGCVYELSTGNNAVIAMAWDSDTNTLYAATKCTYVDRLGYHHDYRRAKIPRGLRGDYDGEGEGDEDEETEENDDDDDDWDDDTCWPKSAHHHEDYFGYNFDAGEHRLYRYVFKSEPDTKIVPSYGDATMEVSSNW